VLYVQVIRVKFHFHLIFILISRAYMTNFRRYIVVKLRLTWFPADLDVLLTVHLSIFISVFNQLDAQNLFHNKFHFMPLHVSSTCAHL